MYDVKSWDREAMDSRDQCMNRGDEGAGEDNVVNILPSVDPDD